MTMSLWRSPPPEVSESDPLSVPPGALQVDSKGRVIPLPWIVEGSLAGAGAVGIGMSGATTTTQLATILVSLSLGGAVVLLVAEARARRRWTLR